MPTAGKRIRKTTQERRREIVAATLELVATKGYNGLTLDDIAQEIKMTRQGLLHYVGNKEGALSLLVTEIYDAVGTPENFFASGEFGSNPQGPLFPAYLRYLVRTNEQRRVLVQLFVVLESESFTSEHPLHDYFRRRPQDVWDYYSKFPWKIPPSLGSWNDTMRPLVRMGTEAMDGIQLRWLREPAISLYDEWLGFERLLFPSPLWDDYK